MCIVVLEPYFVPLFNKCSRERQAEVTLVSSAGFTMERRSTGKEVSNRGLAQL